MSNPQEPTKTPTQAAASQATKPVASAPTTAALQTDAEIIAAAQQAGVTPDMLEDVVSSILNKRKAAVVDKLTPKEPDYSTLGEADIYSKDVYIPVIEHELPDYMNIHLKDQEYVPVWANKDQRRLGALLAEGYEVLKKEHVAPGYQTPLKFSSEGTYEYQDVICLRVHKRIRFAKLRKIQEVSQNQLKPVKARANAKARLMEEVIANDPALDVAFGTGKFGFYDTDNQ